LLYYVLKRSTTVQLELCIKCTINRGTESFDFDNIVVFHEFETQQISTSISWIILVYELWLLFCILEYHLQSTDH
jgi:hypothetical protein